LNKKSIFLVSALALTLTACDSGGKKVVDTKDGVIVTTVTGDLYKIIGTEMYEIKKHDGGFESGYLKLKTIEVASRNAKIKIEVKAKVFNDKTDYIVDAKVVPGSIKNKALSVKDILSLNDGTIDGISSVSIVYEDAEGFSLGNDEISVRGEWSRIVDENDNVAQVQFKGTKPSDKQRANKDTMLKIQWRQN
jgi:hypothetical protein